MRTSLNIPQDVLESFDETWRAEGFESRSRAVREAISEYIESHVELEATSGDIAAVLAFDYEHRTVIEELHTVQHEFQDIIDTTSHTHQGEWCLEAVFCRVRRANPRTGLSTPRFRCRRTSEIAIATTMTNNVPSSPPTGGKNRQHS